MSSANTGSNELLLLERRGHTAIITINNPPANTWTPDSLIRLKSIIEELNADLDNYALILTSNNEKFFSAGADLNRFQNSEKGFAFEFATYFGEAFQALTNYRGVSIAAITGFAMGGGLEAAMCCDIRIAEAHAQMALPEATVGLLPAGLGTQHLTLLVGEQWAKRLVLLGERVKAEQALQIGLISEIVPTGKALERALELTAKVEKQSPTSVRYCKELIHAARDNSVNSNFPLERQLFVKLWDSEDQKEGVNAFIEKRAPQWKNR